MANRPLPDFMSEIIQGATGPCKSYHGFVAGISTPTGTPAIVMAATRSALVDLIKEISPSTSVDVSKFIKANIISDVYVKREDDEL